MRQILAAVILVVLLASGAQARTTISGSITGIALSDRVVHVYETTTGLHYPGVTVGCTQAGAVVYSFIQRADGDDVFVLTSPFMTPDPADCTVSLWWRQGINGKELNGAGNYTTIYLDTATFTVPAVVV